MAVKKLESLVLRGVAVLSGESVQLRAGSYAADMQMPMVPFSMRHPLPGCRENQTEPPPQSVRDRNSGADGAATRAGRPDGLAGVLVRRSPARNVGRAVLLGWPIAAGASAHRGTILPGRPLTFAFAPGIRVGLASRPLSTWCGQRQQVDQAASKTAWGTPAISTGGSGD